MKRSLLPFLTTSVFIISLLAASLTHAESMVSVATGFEHTCAVTTSGGVECWGDNIVGQLGNDSLATSAVPVRVLGLSSGVSVIATGYYQTCALTTSGAVKCWGSGYLGNNTTTNSAVPVDVVGLSSGVSAISTGVYYTCALTTSGGVKCWGDNYYGELGNNTTTNSTVPVDVVGLSSGVSAISAGDGYTCAVTTSGGVKCWGADTDTSSLVPVDVVGLSSGVSAIATGWSHICALMTSGGVKCWGDNYDGELGNNTTTDSAVPVDVVGLSSGVSAIAAGAYYTCAVTTSGGVKCWGKNNTGQLGNNSTTQSNTPVNVVGLSGGVSAVAVDYLHTCAVTTSGGVKCWGYSIDGELGNGSTAQQYISTPVDVIFGFVKTRAVKNDFSGDGKSDVLFLNTSTGAAHYWNDASKSQSIYVGTYDNADYSYAGSGDFDGDGKADLLFIKASNHATLIWSGAVKTAATYPGTSPTGFNLAAICDVNGDGRDDLVWFNPTTGKTQVWSAAAKAAITYPGAQTIGFTVAACADFNGDGMADIYWHNSSTGVNQIWPAASKVAKTNPGTSSDLTWMPFGAGDIDGDGKSDLVWYKASSNNTMVWKGGLKSAISYPGTGTSGFTPKAISDYDGDGKADLLWANDTTLATQIWPAFNKANVTYPGAYPAGFTIQK
jgi:alpha-tubulin suppressor-like RCC1 family protein